MMRDDDETPEEKALRRHKENRVIGIFAAIAAVVIAYYSVVYRNQRATASWAPGSASASAGADAGARD